MKWILSNQQKIAIENALYQCECIGEIKDNGVYIEGFVFYDKMVEIVEILKFRIRKGYLYKCKKDVYDNRGEVCLFNKDEIYLSPEDNLLLSNNGVRMVFQEWHKPQELFEEVDEIKTEK